MHVALPAGRSVLLFRVHAARIDHPYRLVLSLGAEELARQDIYQSEAFLLSGTLDSAPDSAGLAIRTIPLDGLEPSALNTHFAFSYAAVLNR